MRHYWKNHTFDYMDLCWQSNISILNTLSRFAIALLPGRVWLQCGRDIGLIPESESSPGEGNGNLIQYSCLGNPMDIGAWQAPWGHKESNMT